jgi:hypothetical protein
MSTKLPEPYRYRDITELLTGAALEAVTKNRSIPIPKVKSASIPKVPNWKEWSSAPEVRIWQACALSLNIDPHSMTKEILPRLGSGPFFEPKSFPSSDIKAEFERRQNALFSNLSNGNYFAPCIQSYGTQPGNSIVRLSQFAAWAVLEVNWEQRQQATR